MSTESAVLTAVLKHLGNREDCRVWRNQTGALPDASGRVVRFGLKGSADVIGVCRRRVIGMSGMLWLDTSEIALKEKVDGKWVHAQLRDCGQFLAIECKSSTGRQSPAQVAFQRMIESFGGLYILENDPSLPNVRRYFP